jgi:hypothetical protein
MRRHRTGCQKVPSQPPWSVPGGQTSVKNSLIFNSFCAVDLRTTDNAGKHRRGSEISVFGSPGIFLAANSRTARLNWTSFLRDYSA